ncbi:MAG TPA: hypothetical protein VK709_13835 [Candidatus Saccharimonadales bacterium]|jgi:hypothetical protein|nr:hypothetical protein [Candidatus Saccharimonadales bacterium]
MAENVGKDDSLIESILTSEIGSPESRAAARRLVEQPTKPPNLVVIFVNPQPRNDLGELLGPVEFNSQSATIEGSDKKLIRMEGETQEHFEQRVTDELSVIGRPQLAYLSPDAE